MKKFPFLYEEVGGGEAAVTIEIFPSLHDLKAPDAARSAGQLWGLLSACQDGMGGLPGVGFHDGKKRDILSIYKAGIS